MQKLYALIAVVLIAAAVYAWASRPVPNHEPIRIGVIAPLTDAFAQYGEEVRKGIFAAEGSSSVQFIFEDEKCDAKTAVSAFQKLTSVDGVKFIIGPGCGSPQEAIVPLLQNAGVVVLAPSAASRDLYQKSGGYFFDIQYSLEDESRFVAQQMYARGYKKVALITYANSFSDAHAKSFRANFKGSIVIDERMLQDSADLLPLLTKIKAAGVDAIYAPDISFFFSNAEAKMAQLALHLPVFSTYVAELPGVRPLVEGVIYSFPANLPGSEGGVYALSKAAAEVLAPAVVECKENAECVKQKLLSSGQFDQFGVAKRELILKKIEAGQVVKL